jgi:uncharacterized damage-inducible protein DinB
MAHDTALREHLLYLLKGGGAHLKFEAAVKGVSVEIRGKRPKAGQHTLWELLEHMRIAQWDILRFSIDRAHVSPAFPHGYWPATQSPPNARAWAQSIRAFQADLEDESTDLTARIPHGEGQTILREALLVADHNAYHLGQIVLTRQLLGAWE